MDEEYGTVVSVVGGGATRSIDTNSLPDHATGAFPNNGNPNTISAQTLSYGFPTEPTFTGDATFARAPGIAVNGVPFEPGTAESVSCESGENFRIEALQEFLNLGLDFNNAHVQPTGKYHYHGVSQMLVDAYAADEDLVHVGFAADGFLMYYSKSGDYRPSYVCCRRLRAAAVIARPQAPTTPALIWPAPRPTGPILRIGNTAKGLAISTSVMAPPSTGSMSMSSPEAIPISRAVSTASLPISALMASDRLPVVDRRPVLLLHIGRAGQLDKRRFSICGGGRV